MVSAATRRTDSLRRASELAAKERPFAVVTVVRTEPSTSASTGERAVVLPDGSVEGWVGGGCIRPTARREALAALEEREPRFVRITPDDAATQPGVRLARMTCTSEGTVDLYVEPFLPRPTLLAAGESPVMETLAAMAPPLGFRFVRLDAGEEPEVPHPPDTWMAVATFGAFDEDAIEAGLKLELPYVGLIASERRAGSVLSELRARGYGEEDLGAVRSPAGLPLGAGGPEGISLSVMAEIVSLRAEGSIGEAAARVEEPATEATDPVCGMSVETEASRHTSEHGGRHYYFCCAGCKRAFDAEPEKFASRLTA